VTLFLLILGSFYFLIILYFLLGVYRISSKEFSNSLTVSVLVPARNEENQIIACLESLWKQDYSKDLYEVYVIDDHSTDNTAKVVAEFIKDKPNYRLLRHKKDPAYSTFKKQALKFALQKVSSDIVMTIDADSVAMPSWIRKMVSHYDDDTGLVAGLVSFRPEHESGFFHKIQTLEFAGIVFCGVGAVGHDNPLICNGSNLSYRMQAFKDAGGYQGNEFLPSGDDDLLLQNIHNKTSWKLKYALDSDSINYTMPVNSLSEFINQRARWASKSLHYPKKWLFLVMFAIYVYYALIIFLIPLVLAGLFPWKVYLIGLLLKMIPEALIISRGLKILGRKNLRRYFLFAQLFQIVYVLIVGFMGFFKKFEWKRTDGKIV
jgi:cellulose synthase/poly-beta-1,6-N-acetylglucosamine synthase-like glycosyltransferase